MKINIPPTLTGNDSSKMQKIRAALRTPGLDYTNGNYIYVSNKSQM
jgi:hypothetical protein